jgi:hypothetical protein
LVSRSYIWVPIERVASTPVSASLDHILGTILRISARLAVEKKRGPDELK